MKRHLKYLSLDACKNHLGLNVNQIRAIDQILDHLGGAPSGSLSVVFDSAMPGGMGYIPHDSVFWFNGKKRPGLVVRFPRTFGDADNELNMLRIGSPWDAIVKGAPATGHCVYNIVTASPARIGASVPKSKQKLIPSGGDETPFDLTRGKTLCYIGKTSVGVARRFKQHIASLMNGGNTKFYRVMRGIGGSQPQVPSGVFLVAQKRTEEAAYAEEERIITSTAEEEDGIILLNTVCSRESFAELAKMFPNTDVKPEYAEERLAEMRAKAEAKWDDPQYAMDVICNNERNLGYLEVTSIRSLSRMNMPEKLIANKLKVNVRQVRGVLSKKHYSRVW